MDINTWQIRNGKLYLNLNPTSLGQFSKKFDKQTVKADKNWPDIVRKNID